jgi:hypothetical protein
LRASITDQQSLNCGELRRLAGLPDPSHPLREIALAIDSDIRVLVNEVEDILTAKAPRRKR